MGNKQAVNYSSVQHNKEAKENSKKSDSIKTGPPRADYEYLIFEGGGVKGLAYGGALKALTEAKLLNNIKGYAGASAGAITATLCAIGYTPDEISAIIKDTDFSTFLDHEPFGIISELYELMTEYGEHSGIFFHKYMQNLIKEKTGDSNYTFGELYEDKKIQLVVVATDLNKLKTVYFSHQNYRTMPIADAVRMSMSIPFLFHPVKFNDQLFVDGGLIDNYPLHVFDGDFPGDPKTSLGISEPNMKVLGFKLVTPNEECDFQLYKPLEINSIKSFSYTIIETLIAANERKYIKPTFWKRTLPIYIQKGFPATRFALTLDEKDMLIKDGIDAVESWL